MTGTTSFNILNGYPREIQNQISDLTRLVTDILKPKAIYLLGSAARGELSWMRHPTGKIELFSDYELAIITHNRPKKEKRQELEQHIRTFEHQISNPNPLFHVDILYRTLRRLSSMPRIIFTYEMKQNACILYGDEIRDMIPEVTLDNLDFQNTHEILYKRLWAILLYLPESFVLEHPNADVQRVAGYCFCRNALDLTTIFLPVEGYLLPTYRQRVNALIANTQLLGVFGNGFSAFMQTCLERRMDLEFSTKDLVPLYEKTIGFLEHGLSMLLHNTTIDQLPQHSRKIYNEHPISRGEWYNLLRLTYHKAHNQGLLAAIRWLRLPVKGWLTLGLLMMHKSLLSWLTDNGQKAENYILQAEYALRALLPNYKLSKTGSFPDRWFALRRGWAKVWHQHMLFGTKSAEERINTVLDWDYE